MHRCDVRGTDVVLKAIGRGVAGIGHDVDSVGTGVGGIDHVGHGWVGLFDALLDVGIAVVNVVVVVVVVRPLSGCRSIFAARAVGTHVVAIGHVGAVRVRRHCRRRDAW